MATRTLGTGAFIAAAAALAVLSAAPRAHASQIDFGAAWNDPCTNADGPTPTQTAGTDCRTSPTGTPVNDAFIFGPPSNGVYAGYDFSSAAIGHFHFIEGYAAGYDNYPDGRVLLQDAEPNNSIKMTRDGCGFGPAFTNSCWFDLQGVKVSAYAVSAKPTTSLTVTGQKAAYAGGGIITTTLTGLTQATFTSEALPAFTDLEWVTFAGDAGLNTGEFALDLFEVLNIDQPRELDPPPAPEVPEPTSMLLLGSGVLVAARKLRRRAVAVK